MKVVEQDLLSVEHGIIVHQVNTAGVMGSGVAKAIADKWPHVYQAYQDYTYQYFRNELLGAILTVPVTHELYVCNLYGQHLGADLRPTRYDAVVDGWETIADPAVTRGLPVYVPYLMGCGLGGGNWTIYEAIIDDICPGVTACKLV